MSEIAARLLPFPPIWRCRSAEHEWVEDYYGTGCAYCGLWFPLGGAPWDPVDDDVAAEEFEGEEYDA